MWIMLLIYAGRTNDSGYVYLIEDIPYTNEDLAKEFDLASNTVKLGLETLHRLKMIDNDSKGLRILNWEEYQNVESLDRIREQTRQRVRKFRKKEKQKELPGSTEPERNVTSNATVAFSNAPRYRYRDIDKERDIEEDKSSSRQKSDEAQRIPYQKIVDLYHSICVSLPHVRALSTTRKSQIRSRWKENPDFKYWKDFFERVEHSDFLTGRVERRDGRSPFIADLQWITKQENHLKIMEGKYDNREEVMNADNREIIENIRRLAAKQRNVNGS
jgi:predicted phage replisome organizer